MQEISKERSSNQFFDQYPLFYETGATSIRHGARYECMITDQLEHIEGKSIIDLGSHDGRWSFAAAKNGASKILGFEGRQELVDLSRRNFSTYGVSGAQYEFIVGDALNLMRAHNAWQPDTVFVFGIFYHIHNHVDWISAIHDLNPKSIIIDTGLTPCEGEFDNVVRFKVEDVGSIMSTPFSATSGSSFAFAGHPSRAFIRSCLRVYGYDCHEVNWEKYLLKYGSKGLEDYAEDKRGTFIATRRS